MSSTQTIQLGVVAIENHHIDAFVAGCTSMPKIIDHGLQLDAATIRGLRHPELIQMAMLAAMAKLVGAEAVAASEITQHKRAEGGCIHTKVCAISPANLVALIGEAFRAGAKEACEQLGNQVADSLINAGVAGVTSTVEARHG